MKLLLDTHIFLWFISRDSRLSQVYQENIRNINNEIYLSVVSVWEATVKYQIGKLPLPQLPEIYFPLQRQRHRIATLPLSEASVIQLHKLPMLHRDPFDRMLICQALAHDLVILTVDKAIQAYPVKILNVE